MTLFHPGGIQSLPENISKQKLKEKRRSEKRFQHSLQTKDCRHFQNGAFQFDQFSSNLAQQMELACNGNMEKLQAFSQKNVADLSSNLPCYMLSNNFRREFGNDGILVEDIHSGCPPPKKAKLSISKTANLYPNAERIGSHISTSEKLLQFVGDLSEPSELTVCDFNSKFCEEDSGINSEKMRSIFAYKHPFRNSSNHDLPEKGNTCRDFAQEPKSIVKVNQSEMKEAYGVSNTQSVKPIPGGKATRARRHAGALNCGSTESLDINYSGMSSTDNSRSEFSIPAVQSKSEAQMTVLLRPVCALGKRSSSSQSFLDLHKDFNETEAENPIPQRRATVDCQETVSNDYLNCEISASEEFATTSNYSKMESPSVPPALPKIGSATKKTPYAVPEENCSTENVYTSQLPEECAIGFEPYVWTNYGTRSDSAEGRNVCFSSAFMHTLPGEKPPDDASKVFECPSPQALFYSFADTVPEDVCDMIMSLDNGHSASDFSEEFVAHQIKEHCLPTSGPLIYEVFEDNLSIHTEVRQGDPKMHIAEINAAKRSSFKYKEDCANNNQVSMSACDVVVKHRVNLHSFKSSSETCAIPEFKKPLRQPKRPKKRMRNKNFDGRGSNTWSYKTYTSYYPSDLTDTTERGRHSHSRSKTKGKKRKRFKNPHTQNEKRKSKPKIPPLKIVNCDYKHRKRKSESKTSLWKRLKRLFFCCNHKKRDSSRSNQQGNYGSQYKPHISLFERIVIWWRRKTRRHIVVRKTSLELFRMQRQKLLKEMQEFCEDCKIVSKNIRSLDVNDRLNGRSTLWTNGAIQAKVVSSEGCLVIDSQKTGLDVYLNGEKNIYHFYRKKPVKGILKCAKNNQFSLYNDVNNNQIYAGRYNY